MNKSYFDLICEDDEYCDIACNSPCDNTSLNNYYVHSNNYEEFKQLYFNIYGNPEMDIVDKNTNYTNMHFCNYCKTYQILPNNEINAFLARHENMTNKKHIKYLILTFRLNPSIFYADFVMDNKILREIVFNFLQQDDKFKNNLLKRTQDDMLIDRSFYNSYFVNINKNISPFIYETYFHQPKLDFTDYIKCTFCRKFICPMHCYITSLYCAKCNYCDKKWIICGWCKEMFDEKYACNILHKK